mmetsp:Transcript_40823/g.93682  ORF Transcript_40823/g.93682 Transcript_40823/m.93682 type:complete len:208 (+) Transcript_40823:189-812(+)
MAAHAAQAYGPAGHAHHAGLHAHAVGDPPRAHAPVRESRAAAAASLEQPRVGDATQPRGSSDAGGRAWADDQAAVAEEDAGGGAPPEAREGSPRSEEARQALPGAEEAAGGGECSARRPPPPPADANVYRAGRRPQEAAGAARGAGGGRRGDAILRRPPLAAHVDAPSACRGGHDHACRAATRAFASRGERDTQPAPRASAAAEPAA